MKVLLPVREQFRIVRRSPPADDRVAKEIQIRAAALGFVQQVGVRQ
jgi:hypothetical protein